MNWYRLPVAIGSAVAARSTLADKHGIDEAMQDSGGAGSSGLGVLLLIALAIYLYNKR